MTDFADLLAEAAPAERTVDICLRGDLVAELEQLERDHQQARRGSGKEDGGTAADILDRIEQVQQQMRAATYVFRLRRLPRLRYRQLIDAHPPRRNPDTDEVDAGDLQLGFDREAGLPALVQACTYDPQLTEQQWYDLLGDTESEAAAKAERGETPCEGKLNFGQFTELANAAYMVNESTVSVPFSPAVSRKNHASGDG